MMDWAGKDARIEGGTVEFREGAMTKLMGEQRDAQSWGRPGDYMRR